VRKKKLFVPNKQNVVSLPKVKSEIDGIEKVLREKPELQERAGKFFEGTLLGLEENVKVLTIRLSDELLEEAKNLVESLQAQRDKARSKDPFAEGRRAATKADVIRVALRKGLEVLRSELPEAKKRTKSTRGQRKTTKMGTNF